MKITSDDIIAVAKKFYERLLRYVITTKNPCPESEAQKIWAEAIHEMFVDRGMCCYDSITPGKCFLLLGPKEQIALAQKTTLSFQFMLDKLNEVVPMFFTDGRT